MQLILITLVWSGMVACSGITIKTHGSDIVEREPNSTEEKSKRGTVIVPDECFDDNGIFDSNRGHDSLDCDNL